MESAITQRIKGWTEDWGKKRHKKNDAVSKAMFVNKYKDTVFDLPDADNNSFYVSEDDIGWVRGQDGGWTIYGVCDVEDVNDEKLTPFLAISLVRKVLKLKHSNQVVKRRKYGASYRMNKKITITWSFYCIFRYISICRIQI